MQVLLPRFDCGVFVLGCVNRLLELLSQVNGADNLSRGVEEILFDVVNNFIENVTVGAAHLALHRDSTVIDPQDVLLYLSTLSIIFSPFSLCFFFSHTGCFAQSMHGT